MTNTRMRNKAGEANIYACLRAAHRLRRRGATSLTRGASWAPPRDDTCAPATIPLLILQSGLCCSDIVSPSDYGALLAYSCGSVNRYSGRCRVAGESILTDGIIDPRVTSDLVSFIRR